MSDEEEDGCSKAKSRKEVLCCFGSRFSLVLATKKEKRDEATMETEKWEDLSERVEVTGSLEPVGASRGQSHYALKHT